MFILGVIIFRQILFFKFYLLMDVDASRSTEGLRVQDSYGCTAFMFIVESASALG